MPESVAGGSDGDALLQRVEVGAFLKLFPKLLASGFEEFDI